MQLSTIYVFLLASCPVKRYESTGSFEIHSAMDTCENVGIYLHYSHYLGLLMSTGSVPNNFLCVRAVCSDSVSYNFLGIIDLVRNNGVT